MGWVQDLASLNLANQQLLSINGLVSQFYATGKNLIENMQDEAIDSGAADAVAWLQANRKFIKNNDGVSRSMDYNGETFVFAAGDAFCCAPNEADFFVQKALSLGYNITAVSYATWLTDQNGPSFYFQ